MIKKVIILRNPADPVASVAMVAPSGPGLSLTILHPYESAKLLITALDKSFRGALQGGLGKKVVMLGASTELTMNSAKVLTLRKKRSPRPRSPLRKTVGKS